MTDKKISELTNITGANLADADEFVVVDSSASETKAITWAELKEGLDTGTGFVRITGDTMTGNLSFGDNDKAIFGAGSDLEIYHDGSNSWIKDVGTGSLILKADGPFISLQNSTGNDQVLVSGTDVKLSHSGSTKLATTSTGVDVTGTVTADGLTVDGDVKRNAVSLGSTASPAEEIGLRYQASSGAGNRAGIQFYNTFSNNGSAWMSLMTSDTSNNFRDRILIEGNGDISFYEDTGTTPKFFWDASAETLTLGASSGNTNVLRVVQSLDGTSSRGLSVEATTGHEFGIYRDANSDGAAHLRNNGIDTVALKGGNVGIGTSSPNELIELSSASDPRIRINNSASSLSANTIIGGLEFYTNDGSSGGTGIGASIDAYAQGNFGSNQQGLYLTFSTRDSGSGETNTERMRIDSSGNVGIGTTSPIQKLHLVDSDPKIQLTRTSDFYYGQLSADGFSAFTNANDSAPVIFRTATNERMRIDASGNVGIGTSSPQATLNVYGSDGIVLNLANTSWKTAQIKPIDEGTAYQGALAFFTHPTAGAPTTPTERMRIDSSGNVGIGDTAPSEKLNVAGNIMLEGANQYLYLTNVGTGNSGIYIRGITADSTLRSHSTGIFTWEVTGNEKMRIDSSGNLLVGTTNPELTGTDDAVVAKLAGGNETFLGIRHDSSATSGAYFVGFSYNGSVIGNIAQNGTTGVSYNTSSDYRLKEDVQPMVGASDRVKSMNPVNFAWKADGTRTDGFLAHEAQAVAPYAVTGEKDGEEMQSIDHSKLVPLLTAALQEALGRIETLEAEVAALKA